MNGLPTLAGVGLAALVAGLLFALLFNEHRQFGWYVAVGILGWFISQSSTEALWLSLQPNLFLDNNQSTILGIAELALVGALLSTMICVARSNRRQLLWPLSAGTILYPVAAYLFPQLLLHFRIQYIGIEHLWFFIALTFLVVIQLSGAIWLAIKSDRKIPWLVVASIPGYPLVVYISSYLVTRFHLYFSQPWHSGYTVMDLLLDIENTVVPGIIFGIVLGLIFGWQRRSMMIEAGSLKVNQSTL